MGERRIQVQPSFQDVREIDNEAQLVQITQAQSKEAKLQQKRKELIRRGFKKAVRTIFLLGLNLGFILLGGLMFSALEEPNEKSVCNSSRDAYLGNENSTLELLMDMSSRLDGISTYTQDRLKALEVSYGTLLDEFAVSVIGAAFNYNTTDCDLLGTDEYPVKWSFMPAALFSMTIVATIGYGNIAPVTTWGRIVCIAYALVGIPLFMFCLAAFGSVLAFVIKSVYQTVCCCGCCHKDGNADDKDSEKLITASNGAISNKGRGEDQEENEGNPAEKENFEANEKQENEDGEDEEDEEENGPSLPLTITIAIFASAVFLGGILFNYWEEWDLETAVYFSYITLTSIGFGDYVPGTSANVTGVESALRSMTAMLFIIIGMACVSMVFALIADEVSAKFVWLGQKCKKRPEAGTVEKAEIA